MDIVTTLLIILLCLLLEAFFSGSEIGVISADQIKLRHKAAKGSAGAKLALKMLEKPEWLLSTTLVGTNISVVTNTTMTTALMIHLFGDNGSWLAVIFAAPLIWIFGEIVPKSIFQQRADSFTPYIIFILRFFSWAFFPILFIFTLLTRLLTRLAGGEQSRNPFTLREEIVTMLQMKPTSGGDIHSLEQEMIKRMFNFSETTVADVMLPLIEVSAIEKGVDCAKAREISAQHAHIRLPVYDQRIDRIVGILHTLDLLGEEDASPITPHIRPAFYVPTSKSIMALLRELRQQGSVIAIVVDEFGGAEGIVTMEDIMEEVVEELEDEYDDTPKEESEQWLKRLSDKEYIVSARFEIDRLNQQLEIDLPQGSYATLAGLILDKTHTVPSAGTTLHEKEFTLTVLRSSAQSVKEVKITW
ncbi:MAG: HlyC/CorC family transporter [Gammaproteobacteria bacterium]|nr:HlyC/CorC family transporter [Gammaproteobacteria bacterium]